VLTEAIEVGRGAGAAIATVVGLAAIDTATTIARMVITTVAVAARALDLDLLMMTDITGPRAVPAEMSVMKKGDLAVNAKLANEVTRETEAQNSTKTNATGVLSLCSNSPHD
jgi:hypothetical protein